VRGDWIAIEIAPDAVKWARTVLNLCRGLLSVIRNTFVHLPDIGSEARQRAGTGPYIGGRVNDHDSRLTELEHGTRYVFDDRKDRFA
jgi:hypothetical protein